MVSMCGIESKCLWLDTISFAVENSRSLFTEVGSIVSSMSRRDVKRGPKLPVKSNCSNSAMNDPEVAMVGDAVGFLDAAILSCKVLGFCDI